MKFMASWLKSNQVSFLQILLKQFVAIQIKLDLENKQKEVLGEFTEDYVSQTDFFIKFVEEFSLNEWSVFFQAASLSKSLKKETENFPLLLSYSFVPVKKSYDRLYSLSELIAPESLELQEYCLLTRASHYLSFKETIEQKIFLDKEALSIHLTQYRDLISKHRSLKSIIFGLATAKGMAIDFNQTYAQETSEYFIVKDKKLCFKDDLCEIYQTIYQLLARRNKPSFLQFEFDGEKYQFPQALGREIVVVKDEQKLAAQKAQQLEDFDVDAAMAEFGLEEETSVKKSKKGQQQKLKKKGGKGNKAKGAQQQKKREEQIQKENQEDISCSDGFGQHVEVDEQMIFYTRAARSWLKNSKKRLEEDGYLMVEPTTKEQQTRKNILEKIMRIKNCDKFQACEIITDNHTLPCCMDKYVLEGQKEAVKIGNNKFSVTVPMCRTFKAQKEMMQMGKYELFFHKTKNGHLHVYHRLFKEQKKQYFLRKYFSEDQVQVDPQILIKESEFEIAIEQDQVEWQPAKGTWNIDASSELFIKFEDTQSDKEYYLFR
jgi:hypothetical protein